MSEYSIASTADQVLSVTSNISLLCWSEVEPNFDRKRASELMDEQSIDVLLASSKRNVSYVSGWFQHLGSYWEVDDYGRPEIFFAGLPRDSAKGDFLVCNSLFDIMDMYSYRDSWIKDRYFYGSYESVLDDLVSSDKIYESAVDCAIRALKDRSLEGSCIGVEIDYSSHASDVFSLCLYNKLKIALPKANFRDASRIICELRMTKSREEIGRIRKAAKASEYAIKTAFDSLAEGMTELEFEKTLKKALIEQDADHCLNHIVFNPSKFDYCGGRNICWATDAKLKRGDVVWVDLVAGYRNYVSDMCRTRAFGNSDEAARINRTLIETNEKLKDEIRPGVKCSDIFKRGYELMERSGCSLSLKTVGHGIGVSIHEPPYMNSRNDMPLRAGMVLALELMAERKALVIGLEDDILVTKKGSEPITNLSREIE